MSSEHVPDSVELPLPKGVQATAKGGRLTVKGPNGSLERPFPSDVITLSASGGNATLKLTIPPNRKKAKSLLNTWEAHLRNLTVGVTTGFEAKMKVVAAHFPMKVSVKDGRLVIDNFLGEKYPRSAPLCEGVEAKVDGEFVLLSGHDIELVGQSAANIERATHIRDYDPRVFQDGIYIVERAHPRSSA